ncbi:NrfD/PsrC family molybdoenzyme membrane anchor subunit [Chloroflexota bacterium]
MRPYYWMVKRTPQTEWIERKGILLWLAFFFIELGAGIFFIAAFFDSLVAMVIGWLVCGVLGGGLHLLYLGKPRRFYRMVLRPQTSWIARGLLFVALFLILGLVHMVLALFSGLPTALIIVTNIFAFLTIIYGGFAMNSVNGIPLWNTALLPVLYVISGLWGGAEVTLGVALATGETAVGTAVEEWIRILLIGFVFLILVYLISVRYVSVTGEASIKYMVLSKWSPLFWIGVVILGMVIPSIAIISSFLTGLEASLVIFLYVAIFCGLVGDLAMRYLILKCAFYSPLIPTSSQPYPGVS